MSVDPLIASGADPLIASGADPLVASGADPLVASGADPLVASGSKAKGKRPAYFDDPAVDRLLSMVLALASDVAVLRERLDTVERLLDAAGVVTGEQIEAFRPDREAAYQRGLMHRELVARLLRGVQQDMEGLAADEPAVEAVSAALRDS